jgi:periplasmic protein CpxP/Spy
MNWRIFLAVTGALLIFPLSTYAAESNQNQKTNQVQEQNSMTKIAQHSRHGKKGEGMQRVLQQLDLTPEQLQQIEVIQEKSKNQSQALHQQMQTQHDEMRSLLASDATPEQLQQQHQQAQDIHQQLDDNRFETMLQIREILTPEQRTQMAELMAQRPERRGNSLDR